MNEGRKRGKEERNKGRTEQRKKGRRTKVRSKEQRMPNFQKSRQQFLASRVDPTTQEKNYSQQKCAKSKEGTKEGAHLVVSNRGWLLKDGSHDVCA
jgi:hypothetical protein